MLRYAAIGGALRDDARLAGADLWGAKLRGIEAPRADLKGANARLRELDLGSCDLRHLRQADAGLDRTRLRLDQLGVPWAGRWRASGKSTPRL